MLGSSSLLYINLLAKVLATSLGRERWYVYVYECNATQRNAVTQIIAAITQYIGRTRFRITYSSRDIKPVTINSTERGLNLSPDLHLTLS